MELNQISEYKVIAIWICSDLPFLISSISIYYGTQSDIRVKSYCHLNLHRVSFLISSVSIYYGTQSGIRVKSCCRLNMFRYSIFNFEHLDILWDSIGHSSQKLLWFEFADSFCIQFRSSRIIKWLNRTSESKFIVV